MRNSSAYLGQEPFLAGVDPKARDGGGGETGAVGGLLHTADLGHGPLLLVLLLGGGRHDVHVMLLLCQMQSDTMLTRQSDSNFTSSHFSSTRDGMHILKESLIHKVKVFYLRRY